MTKFGVSALLCAGLAAVGFTAPAHATTYNLVLTDSANTTFDGTGTLIVAGTPTTGQYCLSGTCTPGDVLTSLSFSIDGNTFSFSTALMPSPTGVSATFINGVLSDVEFDQTIGQDHLHLQASGNLTYSFAENNGPVYYTTGTLSGSLAATPLPAALPMFAGGLGLVGFLARRKKRKATA